MIRALIVISLLFFSLSLEPRMAESAAPQQKSVPNQNQWALLIGISDYQGEIQDLRFASADARAIKELLVSSAGFPEDHIRLLTDDGVGEAKATKQNIFAAIDRYLAPRVQPGHQIIVFLAGHGVVRGLGPEAKSYLLPVDVDAQTKESLERTAIDMEELTRKLSTLKASQFTIFFDACRDDPFPGRGLKGNTLTDVTARLLTRVTNRPQQQQVRIDPPTSVIFYACQVGERAYENAQLQHGVFTYYILRGLRELADRPDGRVEAGRLAGYLSENVRRWVKEQARMPIEQNPTMIATEVRGPVLIARVTPISNKLPALPSTAGLLINTSPEGAMLTINGQQAGRGPLHKEVTPNQYTIRAELPGFQPAETKVNVIAGYQQEIAITLQPVAGSPSYEKGLQFEKQQLWPQAIASYEQALRDDPNSMAIYERLSQAYVKNGRYQDAIALLTTAAQKFPDNAALLARRSRAKSSLATSDDPPLSAPSSAFKPQALTSQSEEESGKKGKKSKKSKKSEAEEEIESEVKEGKSGKSGKKSGKKNSAKEEIGARTITAGGQSNTNQSSGNDASLIAEAIRDAELAIQKNGGLAEAHLALGFAYLADANSLDRALAAFVRASTLAPEEAEAYFGVGSVYRQKQQYQQAAPQLKKAIELRPDYYEAQRELAYCYHAMGATDQAIRQYEVASSYRGKTKDSSEVAANNLALATLYKKKGDEVGGAEGEDYKKASKAYEDDAKKEEPSLKKATRKLAIAGVVKLIENHLSPETRKIWDNNKSEKETPVLKGGKVPINLTAPKDGKSPINLNIPIGGKTSKDDKAPKDNKAPISVKVPLGGKTSKDDKTPKDNKAPISVKVPLGGKSSKETKDSKDSKDSKAPTDNKSSKDTKSLINIKIPIESKSSKDSKAPTDNKAPTDTKPVSRATPKVEIPLKKPL